MKSAFVWIAIGITAFLLLVGVIFTMLVYLEPIEKKVDHTTAKDQDITSPIIKQKETEIERLNFELDSLKNIYSQTMIRYDSLQNQLEFNDKLIREYRKTIDALNTEQSQKNQSIAKIIDLAKTFESMKVAEMEPILRNLDDQTIILLYENINPRSRKNLLMGVSASRAANITQKIIRNGDKKSS